MAICSLLFNLFLLLALCVCVCVCARAHAQGCLVNCLLLTPLCSGFLFCFVLAHLAKSDHRLFSLKDICGYFQCAPFPRLQTGKVVWVLSFDP